MNRKLRRPVKRRKTKWVKSFDYDFAMRRLYINLEKPPINHDLFCLSLFYMMKACFSGFSNKDRKEKGIGKALSN